MENTEEMHYAVFSITNRELLFACNVIRHHVKGLI